jgi:hypothetical protein
MAGPVAVPELAGQRPGHPGAHRLAVDQRHRHDPARRRRDQHLLRLPQIGIGQPALLDRLSGLPGQLDHRAPGHSGQRAAGRSEPPAVRPGEHVVPGPLGERAGQVPQHHQVGAVVVGLQQPEVQIQPVVVLDARVHAVRRDADHVADPQARPALLPFGAGDPYERHGEAVPGGSRGAQVAAAGRQPAARACHRYVGLAQPRLPDAPVQDGLDLGAVVSRVEPQPGHAGREPVQVVRQPEEAALPDVHHVVSAVRPGQPQVEDRDLGFLDRAEAPVDPGRPAGPRRSGGAHLATAGR